MKKYVPKQSDIVWIDLNKAIGTEIQGWRMGLVVSHSYIQENTGKAIICPVTTKTDKIHNKMRKMLNVILPEDITGKKCAIISDEIKSIDFNHRESEFVATCPEKYLKLVIKNINKCLSITNSIK